MATIRALRGLAQNSSIEEETENATVTYTREGQYIEVVVFSYCVVLIYEGALDEEEFYKTWDEALEHFETLERELKGKPAIIYMEESYFYATLDLNEYGPDRDGDKALDIVNWWDSMNETVQTINLEDC